jgi:hypothetical protein
MSQDIAQNVSKTREDIYDVMTRSINDARFYIEKLNWLEAIEKLEIVSTTLSGLAVENEEVVHDNDTIQTRTERLKRRNDAKSRNDIKETMEKMMKECIDTAPSHVLAEISDVAWAICPEEPLLRTQKYECGGATLVEWYRFRRCGSSFDPLCLCRDDEGNIKAAVNHWCVWCASAEPAKYTVGGLLAYKATQREAT